MGGRGAHASRGANPGRRDAYTPNKALSTLDHRPWPLPSAPWRITQTWNDLLFGHWPVPYEHLRPLVPPSLPLDTFDGQAWIGIVPFWMSGARHRDTPGLPWISAFPELNVRTYVTLDDKPGVVFFSLDAARWLAVQWARTFFLLPYFHARMRVRALGAAVQYTSDRTHPGAPPASLRMAYRPVGEPFEARPGTLEYFLTERYCLYTCDAAGTPYTCEIAHPPWSLQVAEAEIRLNTMADAAHIQLPDTQPLLHFVRRQDMVGWPLRRVAGRISQWSGTCGSPGYGKTGLTGLTGL